MIPKSDDFSLRVESKKSGYNYVAKYKNFTLVALHTKRPLKKGTLAKMALSEVERRGLCK